MLHLQLALRLVDWLDKTHSVLGNNSIYKTPTPETMRKVIALTAPLTYGTQFLCIFISASALVATAAILRCREVIPPIEGTIAQKFKQRAVELVGASTRDRVHDTTTAA